MIFLLKNLSSTLTNYIFFRIIVSKINKIKMSLANNQQGKKKKLRRNKQKNFKKIDVSAEEKALADAGQKPEKKMSEMFMPEEKALTKFERARSKVSHVDEILSHKPAADLRKARVVNKRTDLRKVIKNMHTKKPKPAAVLKKGSQKAGAFYDLWSSSGPADGRDKSDHVADKLFKRSEIAKQTLKVNGQHKKPKHMYKKPNAVCQNSVVAPHAGSSYNPDMEEHTNLLEMEAMKEIEKLEKEEKLKRVTEIDPSRYVTVAEREKEDREGLNLSDSEEEEPEDQEEESSELPVLSNVTVPKTRQKRRREKMQKDLLREQNDAKAKRMRDNEVFRTKTLIKQIKKDKAINEKRSEAKRAMKKLKMPQLSYMKFEEPDQDLLLKDELPESLRQLKPEGDLLTDQYKSFQRRAIVEARKKFRPKKRTGGKVKFQEKRDFREITL